MKKLICIVLFPLVLLVGCGDGSTSAPSKVTYSDSAGKGTMGNYTNADWLYQNYFGDYGVPAEFKQSFMPAIKMLANGFALQLNRNDPKQGDDIKGNIEYFHKQFLQFVASGEAAQYVKSMSEPRPQPPINPDIPRLTAAEQEERIKNYVPPPMSDDAKKAVAEAMAEDERVRAEVKKTAADYKLPYTIEGRDEQWFIYSPTMKGKGRPASAPAPVATTKSTDEINRWNWRMGDIIWSNGSTLSGVAGHVGLVDTTNTLAPPRAIEANTATDYGKGVVVFPNLKIWSDRPYTQIKGYSPKLGWNPSEGDTARVWVPPIWAWAGYWDTRTTDSGHRRAAIKYANQQLGKPYNYIFWDAYNFTKFYCSQLVWGMYYLTGWEILESPLQYYTVVTPAQVTNSIKTTMFNSFSK